MDSKTKENYIKAGKIAKASVEYARGIANSGMGLLELAKKIEAKIFELGGRPAFPVNLSINEVAAHATPSFNDVDKAHGLLKVDLGVHVDGCVADTAFSLDLDNDSKNAELISAAEAGLAAAVKNFSKGLELGELGRLIDNAVRETPGIIPIRNLTGHSIEQYDVHAGVTIANYDNKSKEKLGDGVFAVEPFTTFGVGSIRDGKPSGIYQFINPGSVRSPMAREVLEFIMDEYQGLPFCSRWIHDKFGARGMLALREILKSGMLHEFAQLIEVSGAKVAQAEHTLLIEGKEIILIA